MDQYKGRKSANLKKCRLKIEVYTLDANTLLGYYISTVIVNTSSKEHGALDMQDAKPTKSMRKRGQKNYNDTEIQSGQGC